MTIYERIAKAKTGKDLTTTQKGTLSMIQGEICIDGKPVVDEKAQTILQGMVMTCDKNIRVLTKHKRDEWVLDESTLRDILCSYLPEEMTTTATQEDVEMSLAKLDLPRTMKSIRDVMVDLKSNFAIVDGGMVKETLKGE